MSKTRSSHFSIYLWDQCIQWRNIRLLDAENLYFIGASVFVVINTRTKIVSIGIEKSFHRNDFPLGSKVLLVL